MSDLTEIMRMIYASQPTGQEFYQGLKNSRSSQMDQMALEKAQEDLTAERGLRKLFAESGGIPSYEQIGAYNPKMAMEMQQLGLENRAKEAQIRQAEASTAKTGMEMDASQQEYVSKVFGPIAEEALKTGDMQAYNRKIGAAASDLRSKGFNLPANFNPQEHTPDQVMINALGRGYKSPWMESQLSVDRERAIRGLPPAFTPEEYRGKVTQNQTTGAPELLPPNPNVRKSGPMSDKYGPAPESSVYNVYESGDGQKIPTAGSTDIAAEKARIAEEEATARKRGEIKATERQTAEEKAMTLSSIANEDVEGLIDKSIASKAERMAKGSDIGAASMGQSTEAFEASERLKVIGAQLRAMSKDIIGAGPMSDKDQELLREAAANIASDIPAAARKESFKTFMRLAKAKMQKYPELAAKIGNINESSNAPAIGAIEDGHEFMGGDPADPKNWRAK
jgi:hypothetical protein